MRRSNAGGLSVCTMADNLHAYGPEHGRYISLPELDDDRNT